MSTPPDDEPTSAPRTHPERLSDSLGRQDTVVSSETALSSLSEPGEESDYPHLGLVDRTHYLRGRELARGGMGRIVEARDRRLGRPVALKELLVDVPGLRVRFEREARITARLQHPSIVDIHEAGVWEGGEPFFAMKLVAGRPLDRVIHEARTLPERLALLPTVLAAASAMAYAHQRRVIHRDLKPGNVLVGEFGETVVVDWGLAKDLGAEAADLEPTHGSPLATNPPAGTVVGAVMGTPGYMPPEQARGEPVDERADVYALGAILYHLLGGAPPYDAPSAEELLARVRAGPPPLLQSLAPGVPKDLLTIVATAMARDKDARYRTAKELAEDLARFQTGQLVASHRYTRWQLWGRWVNRNARLVSVAAAAIVLLGAAGGLSLQRIVQERARAEASRAEAEELVEFMVMDLRRKLEPLGRLELLSTVARKAEAYYQHRGEALGPKEQRRRAIAHASLGDVLRIEGDVSGAFSEYRQELAIADAALASEPSSAHSLAIAAAAYFDVADALAAQGDDEGALAHFRRSLAIRERRLAVQPDADDEGGVLVCHLRIGDVQARRSDASGALESYAKALPLAEARTRNAPEDAGALRQLALVFESIGRVAEKRGNTDEALERFRAAIRIRERLVAKDPTNTFWRQDLSRGLGNAGRVLRFRGELTEALTQLRAALAIDERLVEQEPSSIFLRRDLSVDHSALGDVLVAQGDVAGALREFRADMDITADLAARDPSSLNWQQDLAASHMQVGDALDELGESAKALAEYRDALTIRVALTGKDPSNLEWRANEAAARSAVGGGLLAQNDVEGALAEFQKSLALDETLVAADPKNADWADELAVTHADVSSALLAQGHAEPALAEARRALEVRLRIPVEQAGDGYLENLGEARAQLAAALVGTRALPEARVAYREAAEQLEALASKDPSNARARKRAAELRALSRTCCGPAQKPGR